MSAFNDGIENFENCSFENCLQRHRLRGVMESKFAKTRDFNPRPRAERYRKSNFARFGEFPTNNAFV